MGDKIKMRECVNIVDGKAIRVFGYTAGQTWSCYRGMIGELSLGVLRDRAWLCRISACDGAGLSCWVR